MEKSVTRLIVGIDPGLSGAISALSPEGPDVWDMPVTPKGGQGKIKNEIDAKALCILLERVTQNRSALVVMERLSSMPGRPGPDGAHDRLARQQSGAGSFSLGDSVGCIRGVVGALGYEVKWITPTKWKFYWKLAGHRDQKELGRLKAIELYPELEGSLSRKRDHNRSDAVLIARWAWDQEIWR